MEAHGYIGNCSLKEKHDIKKNAVFWSLTFLTHFHEKIMSNDKNVYL